MEKIVIIAGTNASGKSSLGIDLARIYGAEIISADSRQVFEGLDLGSGKVTKEEMKGIEHHLIDVAKPNEFFSLSEYQSLAYSAINDVLDKDKKAFVVGGTGLYINSIADGYNLNLAKPDFEVRKNVESKTIEELVQFLRENNPLILEKIDLKNKRRLERAVEKCIAGHKRDLPSVPQYETLIIGVTWERKVLYERIKERLDRRLNEGMIDEVIRLRENGATDDFLFRLGLEYRYILMYLRGEFENFDAFYNKLFMEIRHLAKEQMTWFRKRQDIIWINMSEDPINEAKILIDKFYS